MVSIIPIEIILFWIAALFLLSVLASKLSDKFAIPALLLFLAIGMLAGSEGLGGFYFDNAWLAKAIGIVALTFIIFSGGIDTNWKETRPVLLPGIVLSTLGVLLTAIVVAYCAIIILKFSFLEGMLLGAIVSSTDAAAVFSILRSKHIGLKAGLRPLLELESGSNDPMAVFLTLGFIQLLTLKNVPMQNLIPLFFLDMGIGLLFGYVFARLIVKLINRVRLHFSGLYPALVVSFVLLAYALTTLCKGNGFLAVYILGLYMGNVDFVHKKTILRFHEGIAWLMQIIMFLTLGLLVFPSKLFPVIGSGLLITCALMFLARPLGIFVSLLPFNMSLNKKFFISWVGLRGAAPIILATFPLLAGVPQASMIFNIVFFVVFASVLIQGTSIAFVAKLLGVATKLEERPRYPIEFEKTEGTDANLIEVIVPFESEAVGRSIVELNVPADCLIVLIARGDKFIIPNGATKLEGGDVLQVLANEQDLIELQGIIAIQKK